MDILEFVDCLNPHNINQDSWEWEGQMRIPYSRQTIHASVGVACAITLSPKCRSATLSFRNFTGLNKFHIGREGGSRSPMLQAEEPELRLTQ
jgi:hypothetical protein